MFKSIRLMVFFTIWSVCLSAFAEDLPSMNLDNGVGKSLSGEGNFISTQAQFYGGISTQGNYVSTTVAGTEQTLMAKAKIKVAPEDVNKLADILFVIGSEPPPKPYEGGVDTVYMNIDETGRKTSVNLYAAAQVWMAQFTSPFKSNITLQNEISVDLGQYKFNKTSQYYLFVGYRLKENGKLVYSPRPIIVDVNQNSKPPTTPPVEPNPPINLNSQTFTNLTHAAANVEYTSNTIIVNNVVDETELQVVGGSATIIKNGQAISNTRTTVRNGDEIALRTKAPANNSELNLEVLYGGQTQSWSIQTATIQNPTVKTGQMSGYTAGKFAVNESGAATYSIPITTPTGTAGIQPQLAFSYTSQGTNGLLGLGWSLSGLSVITRCPATRAQDNGLIDPVDFDDNDRFCLDGERLMAVNDLYGENGTVYYTEQNSFKKVISHGQTGTEKFTVHTKSGLIMEYGYTDDSRIEASGKEDILFWAVNKIQDTAGNYLEVLYQENNANGEYYPVKISYTGNANAGLNTYNNIIFEYESRTDVVPKYIGGSVLKNTQRLKTIKTWKDTTAFRTYHLAYQESAITQISQLISVQECGTDDSCFSPIQFKWEEEKASFEAPTIWLNQQMMGEISIHSKDGKHEVYTDLNGDGLSDKAWIPNGHEDLWVALSNGEGFEQPTIWLSQQKMGEIDIHSDGRHEIYTDLNGDGLSDKAWIPNGNENLWVALSNGKSFEQPTIWLEKDIANKYSLYAHTHTNENYADLNGDGLIDRIWIPKSLDEVYVAISTGNGFKIPEIWLDSSIANGNSPYVKGVYDKYIDLNGDGLVDRAWIPDYDVLINISTGNGFKTTEKWLSKISYNLHSPYHDKYIDINGDGLADKIWIPYERNDLWGAISNGNGFETPEKWLNENVDDPKYPHSGVGAPHENYIDINGDGKTDQIWKSEGSNDLWIAISTGNGFKTPQKWAFSNINPDIPSYSISGQHESYVDLNGDGLADKIWRPKGSDDIWVALADTSHPNLLTTIINGHNAQINLDYKPLTDTSVYKKENNAEYPMMDVQMPIYVVSAYETDNGIGSTNRTSYFYQGAKIDLQGRGFRGFSQTTVTDETSGIATVTYYNRDYRYISTKVKRTEQFISQAGHPKEGCPISDTDYQAELKKYGNGVHFSYTKQTINREYEINDCVTGTTPQPVTTTITTNEYDDYGNPTQINIDYGDGYSETTTNTYINNKNQWFLGRLTQATVTKKSPDDINGVSRTSNFEYDSQTGLLIKETIEPNHPLCLEKVYQHDKFGNIQTSTTQSCASTSPTIEARSHTTYYDDKGRFVKTSQNALGHAETKAYQLGNLTRLTGPNQLTTTWEYDGFGRKRLETRADNTQTRISYLFCDTHSNCPTLAKYFVHTETAGSTAKISYYDILDREIRKETVGFDGRSIFIDTIYNARGEVIQVSDPYFQNDTPLWTTNEYDAIGRLVKQTSPANQVSTTNYQGLTTIATNPLGQKETRVVNVLGKLIFVEDNVKGSIKYAYDGFGNLTDLTDPMDNTTRMEYDQRGNKIRMYDPDTGTTSYTYNALGELITQTDNKGQTVTTTFDKLGRMTKREEPEGISTWQYDSAEKGIGKLAVMTGADGYQEQYRYDSFGRLHETKTVIDNNSYFTSQTYDQYGRKNSVTYPTGFAISNLFNNYGYLHKVQRTDDQKLYWQAKQHNARGQLEQAELGNGLATRKTYDVLTGRIQTIQTGAIQELSFNFDAIGNLTQRKSGNLVENFSYDGLNRLTQSAVQGGQTLTMNYDALGNITYKSDVGHYNYGNNTGIHAVTSAGNINYTYDANGNRITSSDGQTINYTSFNKPQQIIQGNHQLLFAYNPNYKRYKQTIVKAGTTTTKVYISGGLYERETKNSLTKETHYIFAGGESIAVHIENSNDDVETRYLHKDHLGSVESMTDEYGNIAEQLSFDAWGQRRNSNWGIITEQEIQAILDEPFSITRGFTAHEHLDSVNLIHMNGRVYDPVLGRFLSADPFVQSPTNTQSLNRYTYVQNNPLSMVDPSGFFFKKAWKAVKKAVKKYWKPVVAIAAGAILGAVTGGIGTALFGGAMIGSFAVGGLATAVLSGAGFGLGSAFTGTLLNGGSIGDAMKAGLKGAVIGGVTAGLTFGVGHVFFEGVRSTAAAFAIKVVAHGVVQGLSRVAQGGKFEHGFAAGMLGKIGGHFGLIGSIVAAGTAEELGGGKFANGAVSGAFVYLFNDAAKTVTTTKTTESPSWEVGGNVGFSVKFRKWININFGLNGKYNSERTTTTITTKEEVPSNSGSEHIQQPSSTNSNPSSREPVNKQQQCTEVFMGIERQMICH